MKTIMGMYSWLNIATAGIRFGPDREEVQRELRQHIEDKAADLMRIFPGISEEEAGRRALDGMGDAWELKKELAKVHTPWLGWLWTASRYLLCLVLLVNLLVGYSNSGNIEEGSIRGSTSYGTVHRIRGGEKAELGQYTFQITGAACLEYPDREDELQVVLRASSPRFWERINPRAIVDNVTVVGPDGTRYAADSNKYHEGLKKPDPAVWANMFSEWDIGWREVAFFLPAEGWRPGDQVTLELDSEVGRIVLSTAVTERVEMS